MKNQNYFKMMLVASLALLPVACDKASENKENAEVAATSEPAVNANALYLETNAQKDGVIVTESGLQYEIITKGTGSMPTAEDYAEVHYAGAFIDGVEFDSSYERGEPSIFRVDQVISGWTEALQLMPMGSKWRLTIPSDLAYGDRDKGPIPANSVLVFDVELLGIKTKKEADAAQRAAYEKWMADFNAKQGAFLEENKTAEGVITTESGLQYKVITEGNGAKPAGPTSTVTVHYAGSLISGREFDSSYKRGEPTSFPLNRVISGWTEGLQLMKTGAKYTFYIPSHMGYGENGNPPDIPPNATLIFDVELISIDD